MSATLTLVSDVSSWTTSTPTTNGPYWLHRKSHDDEVVYLRDEYVEFHGTEKDIHVSKLGPDVLWCEVVHPPRG